MQMRMRRIAAEKRFCHRGEPRTTATQTRRLYDQNDEPPRNKHTLSISTCAGQDTHLCFQCAHARTGVGGGGDQRAHVQTPAANKSSPRPTRHAVNHCHTGAGAARRETHQARFSISMHLARCKERKKKEKRTGSAAKVLFRQ